MQIVLIILVFDVNILKLRLTSIKMVISIYATVYNNSDIIESSLNSIIDNFPEFKKNFEMIIVDNYSTDGTWEKLEKYAKRYKNFRIYKEYCNRGEGRAIAYSKTNGIYCLYIDLDTVYNQTFARIINTLIKRRIKDSEMWFPGMLCTRNTMDLIGNWKNLNFGEDIEIFSRAISVGVKSYAIPAYCCTNRVEKSMRGRENRYTKNFFGRILRKYRNGMDIRIGYGVDGFKNPLIRGGLTHVALDKACWLSLKIQRKPVYRHTELATNGDSLDKNTELINPADFGVHKKYLCTVLSTKMRSDIYERNIQTLFSFGFNRIKKIDNLHILVYTNKLPKKIINYYERIFE